MKGLRLVFLIVLFIVGTVVCPVFCAEILTWKDCLKAAAANHPDLVAAVEAVKQSAAAQRVTASSLYPQIKGNADAATAKAASGVRTDTFSYGASGSQLLFDGFKTAENVKAAGENTAASQENYRFISSEVRFRLRSAFINVLKAQELIRVTGDIARRRKDSLVLISLRYQSGLEHKGALLTAQANLAQAQYERQQAVRGLEVAQRQLNKEMGRRHFVPMRVEGVFAVSAQIKEKPDFEALAAKNPQVQRLVAQKNAAVFGVAAARAGFWPVVSAQGSAGKTGAHWPPAGKEWNTGLSFSLPIFEGGLKTAQLQQARATLDQAQAQEISAQDGIILSLAQNWAGLKDAVDAATVQKKFLSAAQERAKIAEAQYSIGMISYDNWTIIEDDFVRVNKALLEAQANVLLAEAKWIQAKGETLEYEK